MNKNQCIDILQKALVSNPDVNNLGQFSAEIWKGDKATCVKELGGFSNISDLISQNIHQENIESFGHASAGDRKETTDCEDQLIQQFRKDFSQKENLSKLTTQAWGENKSECLQKIGGFQKVNLFLNNIERNYDEDYQSPPKTYETENGFIISNGKEGESPISKDQNTEKEQGKETLESSVYQDHHKIINRGKVQYGVEIVGYSILTILLLIILYQVIRSGLRYLYAMLHTHRMVYLKVMLPKTDGKTDREQEKEIAKDMKEKIGRMSQVYNSLHKISNLSIREKFMYKVFSKQRISMIYHYQGGMLNFIFASYPEYQNIIESAISAQFPSSSIEKINKPSMFSKKYHDVMPIEPKKDPVYTIKTFKQLPDDPINNIIDTMSKIDVQDTVTMILTIKPEGSAYNKKRQKAADRLYKGLDLYTTSRWHRKNLLNPFKFIGFLIKGPSEKLISNKEEEKVGMVRMIKAQEDSMNTIGEEAGNAIFKAGLTFISSSDTPGKARSNLKAIESALNVYNDEYSNGLDDDNLKHDFLGWMYIPLWMLGARLSLIGFFSKHLFISTNEISSLFHLPDSTYNRSPIVERMPYKVLPAPANLPIFDNAEWNGRILSGILAESYKKGKLSDILKEYKNHRAVGEKKEIETKLTPLSEYHPPKGALLSEKDGDKYLGDKLIVEQDGIEYIKEEIEKKPTTGYKLYKNSILLGVNIYRNTYTPIYMKRNDRTRHFYTVGKSGTGKSVFLQTIARQDVWNGDGVCLIDPHGDLAEDLLSFIPKERAKDVIYFDAGNEERPMGLNLYEINDLDEADRTVNDATEIFLKMFGPEIFGPRIQEYFKYGSLTILEDFEDRPTLLDVVRLFTDDAYREFKLKKVTNAVVRNRWERTYNAMGDREKQEIIPYFSSKFVSFNTNRLIRNIIGQTKSAFNFDDVMNNQKILIVNLSKGKIGEMNAQLLGMILVSKIYTGAMARARIPEKERKDFYLYVDEFQNFVSGTFADILSEARKYRLGLIMAHQYIAQLDPPKGLGDTGGGKSDVKAAVFGNVGTMMSFKIGAPDAEFLEKEYTPTLSPQDIVNIANYKAYVKLNIDNTTSTVFSMNSIYTKDYENKKIVPILQEYSAVKYGRKREFVDAETRARLGLDVQEETLPEGDSSPSNTEENESNETNEE